MTLIHLIRLAPIAPLLAVSSVAAEFEGSIETSWTCGTDVRVYRYTSTKDHLRIERAESKFPHPINLIERESGAVTFIYPHNHCFVRYPANNTTPATAPHIPLPLSRSAAPGSPTVPEPPNMPPAPPMPGDGPEVTEAKASTEILGRKCVHLTLKLRGQVMEIDATGSLMPFENWRSDPPRSAGPPVLAETWGGILAARGLFPLRAVLKNEGGSAEILRFEVKSIETSDGKLPDSALFKAPEGYRQLEPLPVR